MLVSASLRQLFSHTVCIENAASNCAISREMKSIWFQHILAVRVGYCGIGGYGGLSMTEANDRNRADRSLQRLLEELVKSVVSQPDSVAVDYSSNGDTLVLALHLA